ncbi:MAG TPA: lysophospholipid acyltransferase family protein [Candidatus Acidoferrales bacterium]|nr:lysophospholipid acyltransferase family protein [Candidatus Acidoferrales bacterium]
MSLLRSLLFSTPVIFLSTIVLGTLSLIVSFFDGTGNTQHRIARLWGRSLLAASFIRVRIEGLENLDPDGVYVFVANHASLMDIPAFLAHLPYQFRFFAKLGLYRIPFIGTHLRRAGHLPVDRSSARASLKSMTEGARIIAGRRISVLLFPEGGRCPQGLRQFKEGAAYIAIKAGVPVVPMALAGMREKLPMESIHLRSGTVELRIGHPIPTTGMDIGDRVALTQRLYCEIAKMLDSPPAC